MTKQKIETVRVSDDLGEVLQKVVDATPELVIERSAFVTEGEIGHGGFGRVFKARKANKRGGKIHALKELDIGRLRNDNFRRFILEIEVMIQCRSPYFVVITGFTKTPPYCVMSEYAPKGSLNEYCRASSTKHLSPTKNTIIALGVAHGLRHIHRQNIIHRDIKCSNILLDGDMYPHICDFGIARFTNGNELMTTKLGTPSYMAPELLGDGSYNETVDMYAFGMMLFEMAEHRKGISGCKSPADLYERVILKKELPEFDKASPSLRHLVLNLVDHDPNKRKSARETVEYIKEHVDDLFPGTKRDRVVSYDRWAKRKSEKLKKKGNVGGLCHIFEKEPRREPPASTPGVPKARPEPPKSMRPTLRAPSLPINEKQKKLDVMATLPNSGHPDFEEVIKHLRTEATVSSFRGYSKDFVKVLTNPPCQELAVLIMEVVNAMVSRDPQFIDALIECGFYGQMPINKDTIDLAVEFLADAFEKFRDPISPEYQQQLQAVMEISPDKGIILLSKVVDFECVKRAPQEVFTLIRDFFVSGHENMFNSPVLLKLIEIWESVGLKCVDFVQTVNLSVALNSALSRASSVESIAALFSFLSYFRVPIKDIAPEVLYRHLANDDTYQVVLCVLASADPGAVDVTDELVNGLLTHPNDTNVWTVMAKLADSETGHSYFLDTVRWMEVGANNPKDCLRVLMVLLKTGSAAMSVICSSPEYADLLRIVLERTEDIQVMWACAGVAKNGFVSKDVLDLFSKHNFWSTYFDYLTVCTDVSNLSQGIALVRTFCQVGWAPEFSTFAPMLWNSMFQNAELVMPALEAVVELSEYEECVRLLQESDMKGYFEDYFIGAEAYDAYARRIIENMVKYGC